MTQTRRSASMRGDAQRSVSMSETSARIGEANVSDRGRRRGYRCQSVSTGGRGTRKSKPAYVTAALRMCRWLCAHMRMLRAAFQNSQGYGALFYGTARRARIPTNILNSRTLPWPSEVLRRFARYRQLCLTYTRASPTYPSRFR